MGIFAKLRARRQTKFISINPRNCVACWECVESSVNPTYKKGYQFGSLFCIISFVIRLGFEPKTHSLEGCCSIQLSYRTILSEFILLNSGCKVTKNFLNLCRTI